VKRYSISPEFNPCRALKGKLEEYLVPGTFVRESGISYHISLPDLQNLHCLDHGFVNAQEVEILWS
jgi:hypothetical protein